MEFMRPDIKGIGGYIPSSFIDWEGHVSAVLFFRGCNFRCPFCHNGSMVMGQLPVLNEELIVEHIRSRKDFLDGVVISGGEPTLDPHRLKVLLSRFKDMGLPIKLDTNGSNPIVIEELLSRRLVDAIAMDVKAPWGKYDLLCGCTVDTNLLQRSLSLLLHLDLEVEIRTTFVPALMNYDDLSIIQSYLVENVRWVIQCFRPGNAMDETLKRTKEPEREVLREKFPSAIIR